VQVLGDFMSKQLRLTRKIEMVETHNLALSLQRLRDVPGASTETWKRAFYHALLMVWGGTFEERKAIREAMKLP
jgi:hypothetical protein